eukprot:9481652-Pyramimonas_sp.AAC.1
MALLGVPLRARAGLHIVRRVLYRPLRILCKSSAFTDRALRDRLLPPLRPFLPGCDAWLRCVGPPGEGIPCGAYCSLRLRRALGALTRAAV